MFSCRCWRVGRESLWWWLPLLCMTQHYDLSSMAAQLSSIGFSPIVSSLTSPHSVSPQSTSALALELLPKLQLPAVCCAFQGTCVPVRGMHGCSKTVWFSLHLGCHRSADSLSALNVSPLAQTIAPMWGSDPCFSSPTPEGRSSPANTPIFPSSSFILPSFVWFYIFFSTGQVLLSALSWCSACTSMPDDVFLMYPWREMCSMSTYSSAILFSPIFF